jgi:PAS domain S-box-containing protein
LIPPATLLAESAHNVLILLGLIFLVRLVLPSLLRLSPRAQGVAYGLVFGAIAIGAMQASFTLAEGIQGDLRNVVLVGAAAFAGPWPAIVAGAIAALYRTMQGGLVGGAVLAMAGAVALGIAFHWWRVAPAGRRVRSYEYLGLGAALALVNAALPFLLAIGDPALMPRVVGFAAAALPLMLAIYPLAVLALCAFLRSEMKRLADEAALGRANAELVARTEALRASEARFRDFADIASDWLWETDAEHRFNYFSIDPKRHLPTTPERSYGKTRWQLSSADLNAPQWRAHLADLAARRPFTNFEYSTLDPAGKMRWISVSGRPFFAPDGSFAGYRGAAQERTDHKRMDLALQESEARLRAFIDNSPDHISLKDGQDRFLLVNLQFARLYGVDPEQLIGKTIAEVAAPDEAAAIRAKDREVRETGQVSRQELDRAFAEDKRSLIVTKFPIAARDGAPPLVGTIITDVTEFRRLREQLHHAQKMETVGQLTGGIAHDFNNLLTVVLGNIELLMEGLPASPPLLRLAESARAGAIRAAELTSRLLAFSRRQALQPVAFDLNARVAGMAELLHRTLGEQIELRTELAEGLWPALADPGQVESVVLNLAVNARDAMAEGGQLVVTTANIELDEDYARLRDEVRPGAYVQLTVSDTGTGMTPDVVERAFEPFFTTKEVGKGTGLGLSMVYGFVKQSGGHVEIYSEVGLGTTVKVYLPRADATAVDAGRAAYAPVAASRGGERVLVVEDDAMVRSYVVDQLNGFGYDVLVAETGGAALAILDGPERVDLLFTDVVMPGGMTGFALAEAALVRRPGLRILFTSGYAEEALRQRGQLTPGARFLSKPYPRAALAAAIRELLDDDD